MSAVLKLECDKLSDDEKLVLKQFKDVIIPKIPKSSVLTNYVNDDLFFLRWLLASNFQPRDAEEMVLKHLNWRDKNGVDGIFDEDWSQMEKDYPVYFDIVDKQGRPTMEEYYSEWNLSKMLQSEADTQVLRRWVIRECELLLKQVHDARKLGAENVTQCVGLVEISGFNEATQACPKSIKFYNVWASMFDQHYPFLFESIIFIDVPTSFDPVAEKAIVPFLQPYYTGAMKVYRDDWKEVLAERFESSERSTLFGGSKIRARNC